VDLNRFKIIEDAYFIGKIVWEQVKLWGKFERDTLGKQLVRAADYNAYVNPSIALNL
jgi:hypothetical protein